MSKLYVVMLAAVVLAACGGAPATPEGIGKVVTVPNEGNIHVPVGTQISYKHNPPASGSHYPTPAPYRLYPDPVLPGYWVHDLEHGAVVLLYKCPEAPASCTQLQDQMRLLYQHTPPEKYGERKIVITPYPQLDVPVAAVSWDRVYKLQSFDEAKLLQFYREYVDKGREDVP